MSVANSGRVVLGAIKASQIAMNAASDSNRRPVIKAKNAANANIRYKVGKRTRVSEIQRPAKKSRTIQNNCKPRSLTLSKPWASKMAPSPGKASLIKKSKIPASAGGNTMIDINGMAI